jgi:hypothetical protein
MAAAVEKRFGRPVLLECMADPRLLLKKYNEAAALACRGDDATPSTIRRDTHFGSDDLLYPGLSRQSDGHGVVLLPFERELDERTAAPFQADPFGELEKERAVRGEAQGEAVRKFVLAEGGAAHGVE